MEVSYDAAAPAPRAADVARPSSADVPAASAPRYTLRQGIVACAGVFVVIGVLALGTFNLGTMLLLGSFGSTAVIVFAFPDIHFAQPRSVIGGHVICTAVGLAAYALCGPVWWALAAAAAVSLALMMLTRTVHPPAGSNPLIVFLVAPAWGFLLFPTLAGAVVMVVVALGFHRACKRSYPAYWV